MYVSEIKVFGKDPVQQEEGFGLQGELQVQLLQGRSGTADDLWTRAMLARLRETGFPPSAAHGRHRYRLAISQPQNHNSRHIRCQRCSAFDFLTSKNTFLGHTMEVKISEQLFELSRAANKLRWCRGSWLFPPSIMWFSSAQQGTFLVEMPSHFVKQLWANRGWTLRT